MFGRLKKTSQWLIPLLMLVAACGRQNDSLSPQATSSDSTSSKVAEGNADPSGKSESLDDKRRRLLLGTWTDNYKGRRVMTVRADGTATMVVEPRGMAAKIYAKRLQFEERWRLEEGQLELKAIGGEPAGRVKLILKTMGDTSNFKILELTSERLLLLDADGKTRYDWSRVDG